MTHESQPDKPEKIPFDPEFFGLDPENYEVDEAIVSLAEGDMKLFLAEWGISYLETQYNHGEISMEEFYRSQDSLFQEVIVRRHQLGLPERPGYPSS